MGGLFQAFLTTARTHLLHSSGASLSFYGMVDFVTINNDRACMNIKKSWSFLDNAHCEAKSSKSRRRTARLWAVINDAAQLVCLTYVVATAIGIGNILAPTPPSHHSSCRPWSWRALSPYKPLVGFSSLSYRWTSCSALNKLFPWVHVPSVYSCSFMSTLKFRKW